MQGGRAGGEVDWDRRFAGDDYLFGTGPNRFLVSCRDLLHEGDRALCVADGEGRNSVWLASQGLEVDAFDPSRVGVAKARRLAEARSVTVRFEVARAEEWRWPQETYDVVAAGSTTRRRAPTSRPCGGSSPTSFRGPASRRTRCSTPWGPTGE